LILLQFHPTDSTGTREDHTVHLAGFVA